MTQKQPINFKQQINQKLTQRNGHSHTELDTNTFRASSVGYCPRQILINKLGIKKFDPDTQGRFQTGDFIHDWIQKEILPKYATKHENQLQITLENGIKLKGHYDCLDPREQVIYDFKSRSSWYKFTPPVERHLQQLEVYMRASNLENPSGLMVYVSKSDLSVETFPDYFNQATEREAHKEETNKLVEPSNERWNKIKDKLEKVHGYLEKNGFPTSVKEINAAFKPCGDCVGCKFEDREKFDFSHVKEEVDA